MTANSALSVVGERRRTLSEAMAGLESAVASASGAYWWRERVEDALADLSDALEAHVKEVEAPSGLLAEIIDEAPRLGAEVQTMKDEHTDLKDGVMALWNTVTGLPDGITNDKIRRKATSLLGRLTLHRQKGADLIFDAYNVDIAAAD